MYYELHFINILSLLIETQLISLSCDVLNSPMSPDSGLGIISYS